MRHRSAILAAIAVVAVLGTAPVASALPPLVSYTLSGPTGAGGWFVGPVTVAWSVQNAVSSSGCEAAVQITRDTPATTRTCRATNADGATTVSTRPISIDRTPPLATGAAAARPPDTNGFYRGPVAVAWSGLDATLELHYFRDLSQEQIAAEIGLSQAHVSRLIRGALTRLRGKLGGGLAAEDPRAYSRSGMASTEAPPKQSPTHSGRLLVRMPPSLHAELARTAEREGVSLNTLITGALAGAVGWRSEDGDTDGASTGRPEPAAGLTRERWVPLALAANFAIVAVAAIVALALLISAW